MPVERDTSTVTTVIGLVTVFWGVAHMALGVFCDLPGDHWMEPVAGFAPVHWIAGAAYDSNVATAFGVQGILGIMAGSGVLLRLHWGRILTFIVAIVAILWALDAADAYKNQDNDYQWKTALIPFAVLQALYGILAFGILMKNGVAFNGLDSTDQSVEGPRICTWAAWASPSAAAVISLGFWFWIQHHHGVRGERSPTAVLFYLSVLLASIIGGLAAIMSLYGIRSLRSALNIVPGALLGIAINVCNLVLCLVGYAYEGVNPSG